MAVQVARWGLPFLVATGTAYNRANVSAVGGADPGEFVIIWTADEIYGQLYNEDGSKQGAAFQVNTTTGDVQSEPVVVSRNAQDGFAVAFRDFSGLGSGQGTDARLRFFDGSGSPAGPDAVANAGGPTQTNLQNQISIARGESLGLVFVTWTDSAASPHGDGADIRGILMSPTGPAGPDFRITTAPPGVGENGLQAQSNVASLPRTGFVVTWADDVPSGSEVFGGGSKIRGQMYSYAGAPIGSQFDVASSAGGSTDVRHPVSAGFTTAGTQFVTAWVQDDDAGSGVDLNVYARIFSHNGSTPVGGTAFVVSQTTAANQSSVVVAPYYGLGIENEFIVAWTHQIPFAEPEIRARMFDKNGNATTDEFVVSQNVNGDLASIAVLNDTIDAHPIPRFVITWRDTGGNTHAQIFSPAVSRYLGIDWYGSSRSETYTAQPGETVLAGNGGNDTLTGTAAADDLRGGAGRDTLRGLGGNDKLDGGVDIDRMEGGLGNDTYIVDNVRDVVVELANQGTDTVRSTVTYTLAANVENLVLLGAGAINGTGNASNNVITGNARANVLNGGGGNDTLNGGAGNDTLNGGAGNDRLLGVAGNDKLLGGAGNDTLDGGAGIDRMEGGAGNDIYIVDNVRDVIVELANQGTDTVRSTVTYTLAANVENLVLLGAGAINGTGNALANVITGNAVANVLNGANGNDRLLGGGGNDRLIGGNGNDRLEGGAGNDRLEGGAGVDTLLGGAGNDVLIGGLGNDVLTGGAGRDTFLFNTALNAATNRDRITDFNVRDDTIQLENAIFTKLTATGVLNAALFKVGPAATDADDAIIYNKATGALFYDSNGNAAGGSVQFATLAANLNLTAADFFVV